MRIFIDTNILIDYVCKRESFYEQAVEVIARSITSENELCFTDISAINTLYIGKKYGYSSEELSQSIDNLLNYSLLSYIDKDVLHKALTSDWKDKEDALQYYSAQASNADCIITRNIDDFQRSSIPVYTPTALLDEIQ